jgi:hypothetical protein
MTHETTDPVAAVTRLDHARALKRIGAPLNTPVEEREFSSAYTDHWVDLMVAQAKFIDAIVSYSEKARVGRWRIVKRQFNSLIEAGGRCVAFLGELRCGANPPVFKSDQDEAEYGAMSYFLTERAAPFVQYWREAIDKLDAGASLTIKPSDIPRWFD